MRRKLLAGSLAVLLGLAAIAAAVGDHGDGKPVGGQRPTRSSAPAPRSPFPLISKWQKDYPPKTGVSVVYQPIGSGGGIAGDHEQDGRLRRERRAAHARPVRRLQRLRPDPVGAGGELDHVQPERRRRTTCKITGPVIADIYLGDDQEVERPGASQALNPGVSLPDTDITPVYRSDGSGTSYNFTDYLSKVSPACKSKVGVSTQPAFPIGCRRQRLVRRRRASSPRPTVRSATPTSPTRSRTRSSSSTSRTRPASSHGPGLRGIAAAASTITKDDIPPNNEMHIVDPPKPRTRRRTRSARSAT